MLRDIETCARLGCDGVVIGALDADGNVALAACRALIAAAGKLGVTFHRAFDLARDPRRALDDVVTLGCARILTSGQAATATAGANLIRELVDHAAQRIVIMPGSGINAHNLADLKLKTGATDSTPPPNASSHPACALFRTDCVTCKSARRAATAMRSGACCRRLQDCLASAE